MHIPSPNTARFRTSGKDENIEIENKYYPEESEGTSTTLDYEAHETEPPTTPRKNTIINLRTAQRPNPKQMSVEQSKRSHLGVEETKVGPQVSPSQNTKSLKHSSIHPSAAS